MNQEDWDRQVEYEKGGAAALGFWIGMTVASFIWVVAWLLWAAEH